MKYIIEHLEPKLYKWCVVEYKHASDTVNKKNLIFTNIKKQSETNKLKKLGDVKKSSIKDLKYKKICLLDPDAKKTLTTNDCKKFNYLLFGGILGDHPRKHRTIEEFPKDLKYERRNLGNKQMSTNTAVYVAHKIEKGKKLKDLKFAPKLVIPVGPGEEIILPYRYVKENGKIVMPKEYKDLIKKSGF